MAYVFTNDTAPASAETEAPVRRASVLGKILLGMRQGLAASAALSKHDDIAGHAAMRHGSTEAFREKYFG